jgi:ATP-dependent helicase/nuclease subunit A
MSDTVLEKDSEIIFPHVMVLRASAGSGKTHALTKRFAQFLLSDRIPKNGLRNILAITFSNNAAKEMKERILGWLKAVCLGDPDAIREMGEVLTLDPDQLRQRSELLLEEILTDYSDFQVRTIDSFMATIFKASAIDFGYNPDFEIVMSMDALTEYAFSRFLRDVREGTPESRFLAGVVNIMEENRPGDSAFLWDPSAEILSEIKEIYRRMSMTVRPVHAGDYSAMMSDVRRRIARTTEEISQAVEASGLQRSRTSAFDTIVETVRQGRFSELVGTPAKALPVTKPKSGPELAKYEGIAERWKELRELLREHTCLHVVAYYLPYVKAYVAVKDAIEQAKRNEGKVFIEDVNRRLAEYLTDDVALDVYFRIGDVVYHYLIDEFQDTSPIQWANLMPLLENSLAQGGSLFVVGDTKQAIYGFRDADYAIMKALEKENPFPSAHHIVKDLGVNYRSLTEVVDFTASVFKGRVAENEKYCVAGRESGLTDYVQEARGDDRGYVECLTCERDETAPPEREGLQGLVLELLARGYRYGDVAILTPRNDDVVAVSSWLSEKDIPFMSYSSLDVRRRKITGEIIALLTFLDSPPDDLAFATFILGDVFGRALERDGGALNGDRIRDFCLEARQRRPLYKAFQDDFGGAWERYFEGPFRLAGYLPLYDLVSEVYRAFRVFETFGEEEGTLAKILEVIKEFEGQGTNSLRDFLRFAESESEAGPDWNIGVPHGLDAVRVMTVHKAKGLGFPVVIMLVYGERNRGFKYVVRDDGTEVCLLRLNKKTSEANAEFQQLYADEELRRDVSRLNKLYVGLTRAGSELYVLGVRRERESYPFDILPGDYASSAGKPARVNPKGEPSVPCVACYYHPTSPFATVRPGESLNIEERRRGEHIHRVLSLIGDPEGALHEALERAVAQVEAESGVELPADEIMPAIEGFLRNPVVAGYFEAKPGRRVMIEEEFCDAAGRLFRMDRVIVDEDKVTVLDYKTGGDTDDEEQYRAQMGNYVAIVRAFYPDRPVEGVIAYVDTMEVVRLA